MRALGRSGVYFLEQRRMPAGQALKLDVHGGAAGLPGAGALAPRGGSALADVAQHSGHRAAARAFRLRPAQYVQYAGLAAMQAFKADFASGLRAQRGSPITYRERMRPSDVTDRTMHESPLGAQSADWPIPSAAPLSPSLQAR